MCNQKIISKVISVMIILTFIFSLAACSTEKEITIEDMNSRKKITARVGNTVEKALQEGEIALNEKDETEPSRDSKITDDVNEIKINRYAKVTIVCDGKKTEVELVGGTVSDAIKKSNLKLTDKNKLNVDLNAYVEDGMTIKVSEDAIVNLTVDGKTSDIKTSAIAVKDFLAENNIKMGKDDLITPKLTDIVIDGMKVVIKRVEYKEEVKKEAIKFSKKEVKSDDLPKGDSKLTTKGVNGEKEVTYKVKYIDGKEDSRKKISEKITKKPVDQVVTKGTGPENGGTSSNNDSYDDDYDDDYDYDYDDDYDYGGNSGGTSSKPVATQAPKIDEGTIGAID